MNVTALASVKVLFFDTFGTTAAEFTPVADGLFSATQVVLESNVSTVNVDIRARASAMSYDDWFDFGGVWFNDTNNFVNISKEQTGNVDWRAVDEFRIEDLPKLLADHGLVIPGQDANNTLQVAEGSLFDEAQLSHLGRIWHRLAPWPDTIDGMGLLNKKYLTAALSNTYQELLEHLVAYNKIPFQELFSSAEFHSFKPNATVYLGAAARLGVKPEECALVAAHLEDLRGAKMVGFHTIYVERPLEEQNPELRNTGIPDLIIEMDKRGFITLAERLGITAD
ncbi:HAD-like protein [Thozetella sp. PMI_491]|nr:HAD-like protein [Thozetella sp. PMI_491]